MKKTTRTLLIILMFFALTCKEKPTAPLADNPLDGQNPATQGDPFHLQAAIANGGVTLSWQKVEFAGIAGYMIFRSVQQNSGYSKISEVEQNIDRYTDANVKNGQSFWYKINLKDKKNNESGYSAPVQINVSGLPNRAPVASFFIDRDEGVVGTLFTFNADSSWDAEDEKSVLMVRWDWENDTIWDTPFSTSKTITHSYAAEGLKVVKLEVKDSEGGTTSTTRQLNIKSGVMDRDGNSYRIVKIGNQWWMAENLKVKKYRNGDDIPHVTDKGTWSGLTTGAYCNYNNDEANAATYGRLYNWYAVNDPRNIAPEGWHVPSDAEWKQLEMHLGMSQSQADTIEWRGTNEGGKLKEKDTAHWISPNTGATDDYHFTALPGGYRFNIGYFYSIGINAFFWSSTESSTSYAWGRFLRYNRAGIVRGSYYYKRHGFSVRCVRDN